jgi:phosphosulfolactate phosphohydrolase-like enzyme
MKIETILSPAELPALARRDLGETACVVFDILRATSTFVTALASGAKEIIPVSEISEALAFKKKSEVRSQKSEVILLAGERDGMKIRAAQTGGADFDLGNSPREFTREHVSGKTIVATTTNGTHALRACAHAKLVLAGSFLNLRATAEFIRRANPETLLLVCSGTFEETALEDVLGAGALCDLLAKDFTDGQLTDATLMARQIFQLAQKNLPEAASQSRNARRLLAIPELKDDVAFCLQPDIFDFVATMRDGRIVILESSKVENQSLLKAAIRRFDEENSRDPNLETVNGVAHPRQLIYSQWLTEWVLKLCPEASEVLRLAARCQHLCRWQIPRSSYPMTRAGYLQWRSDLKKFHAQKSGEILREVGYAADIIERVQNLNLKKNLHDPECAALEDALCLVFLEHQLADLASKTDDEKVVVALQKSWKKMTPAGHAEALKLSNGAREKALLERALKAA